MSGEAGKAVDGHRGFLSENQSDVGYQCTKSADGRKTATWQVDIGQILPVHHVIIYYSTSDRDGSSFRSQMCGFSLYISNTSKNFEDGKFCDHAYKIKDSTKNISCTVSGRYITYYNERRSDHRYSNCSTFAHNDLCEVEVYGCSHLGALGVNCTVPCPGYCDYCDENGTCLSCKNGLDGHFCNMSELNTLGHSDRIRYSFPFSIVVPVVLVSSVGIVVLLSVVIIQRKTILKQRKQDTDREKYNNFISQADNATYDTILKRDSYGYEEAEERYQTVL
ncbi:uncharacterized protein LOC133201814 [Saccostrea echinata]|uniref:uncharacterized protein LOC133201814 n=1 Tax=Saccostrea echinata TaxID=191078 RepID=UPI002A81AC91|nr:uncharacterized protein LOC133201814 [Saccostrea echinata]